MISRLIRSRVAQIRLTALLLALVVWELAATVGPVSSYLPHIWSICSAVVEVVTADGFGAHLKATLTALAVGVAIGASAGTAIGLLIASNRLVRLTFEPVVVYLAAIPKIVVYPIFVWFFSIGVASKVGMSVLSSFFPVTVSTMGAAWVIRPTWPKAATMLGANRYQRLRYVALPAMAPGIATGIRLGVSVGIVGTLAAETKVGNLGIGYLIINYYSRYDLPKMYATVLIVFVAASIIAIVLERLTRNIGGGESSRASQLAGF